jgi:pimeloyl-ACP methyl ester carboxylesterase
MVLGRLDVMTPARVARKLEQVIPEVRSVVLDNCGHLIMAEKPNQVLDLLLDFLE